MLAMQHATALPPPVQGQALNGELGVGDTNSTYLAVPTAVAGNFSFTDISLGEKFACGIASSKAFCWVSCAGISSLFSVAVQYVTV